MRQTSCVEFGSSYLTEAPRDTTRVAAFSFALLERVTLRLRGRAVICPAIQYAGVRLVGEPRVRRKAATPFVWRAVALEIDFGLSPYTINPESVLARLITDQPMPEIAIRYVSQTPIVVGDDVEHALDLMISC